MRPKVLWRLSVAVTLLSAAGTPGLSAPPDTPPSSRPAAVASAPADPAVDLVRRVVEQEAWAARVDSLRLRGEMRYVRTPAQIEAARAAIRKRSPGVEPTPERFPDLCPAWTATVEVGYDRSRIYQRSDQILPGYGEAVYVWDGREGTFAGRGTKRESYARFGDPEEMFGERLWAFFQWPRFGKPAFWWRSGAALEADGGMNRPERFHTVGRERFRDADCQVVENDSGMTALYVGVADGRLHGLRSGAYSRSAAAEVKRIHLRLAAEHGQHPADYTAYMAWLRSLPPADRESVDAEGDRRCRHLVAKWVTSWLGDYREVAPGCWLPMRQGYQLHKIEPGEGPDNPPGPDLRVVDVRVNQPLPAEWFNLEVPQGAEVLDDRHKPFLVYKEKKARTPVEWQAILEEAAKRGADEQGLKAAMAAVAGKRPIEFPASAEWVNGGPLTWAGLRGKVVLVDCWAIWCNPCRGDWPTLSRLHADRDKTGITVFSIHAAGTPAADVRKLAEAEKLAYPVVVDPRPAAGAAGDGPLFRDLDVQQLPQAFVIGRDGKVAAAGMLQQMVNVARELAGRPDAPSR